MVQVYVILLLLADASVLDAMERMSEYSISSIAVVDPMNNLLGNISMADIRFIFQHGRYNRLWMPCLQFVSAALSQKGLENDGKVHYICRLPSLGLLSGIRHSSRLFPRACNGKDDCCQVPSSLGGRLSSTRYWRR
jgi:hypothetical protein